MSGFSNPFEYDAAPNLDPSLLLKWFIEDHNFSRFIKSSRNVLINGQRGSGKSMALIYNSIPYQKLRSAQGDETFPPSHAGIYVPCNTPLTHKEEHRLLPEITQALLSENYLALSICSSIAKDFSAVSSNFSDEDNIYLRDEFAFLMGEPAPAQQNPFEYLRRQVKTRLRDQQTKINSGLDTEVNFETSLFYSLIFPILEALKQTSFLSKSHLSLLIDDAQDLNDHQTKILNSWIAYREHSVFSFKVAIAGVGNHNMKTNSGGTILEGHDYLSVDLEQPFQNKESGFYKFATDVVNKRLSNVGINVLAPDFFPESRAYINAIEAFREEAKKEALKEGKTDSKSISDYVYKYGRVKYFQNRHSKANKPEYTGFETLVNLSSGVIRNLLVPCFEMYDEAQSASSNSKVDHIPPATQSRVIDERSTKLWTFVKEQLETQVVGCGRQDAVAINNLLSALATFFKNRLDTHKSEPRVVTFIISANRPEYSEILEPILKIAQKAQLIYVRYGTAKDGGGREKYYTPNKMLWPYYGLDVHGQHGRASIKAEDLVAATQGKPIPLKNDGQTKISQVGLFDE